MNDGLILLDATADIRGVLLVLFVILSLALIVFVLYRQTDSSGLAGAFGGAGGGDTAFGAKSQKVADKVIAWMCGIFIVLSLILARISTSSEVTPGEAPPPSEKSSQ